MSDENLCEGDLRLLADFDCPAEELSAMSLSDKRDLIKTIRLSLNQSLSPNHENSAAPMQNQFQQRLQRMGVSMTRVGDASRNDEGDQEVIILKEIGSPSSSSLARTPIRTPSSPRINKKTPTKKHTPSSAVKQHTPIASTSGTRKKIDISKPTKEKVVSPIRPESNVQPGTMPSQDFRSQSFRAEIYALDPLSCTNTELSTLAETSSVPIRKRTSLPFFYTEHSLSLKKDDYVALLRRKFGCVRDKVPYHPPMSSDEAKEFAKLFPMYVNASNNIGEPLDFLLNIEESSAKYNLRQRTAPKRTANDFDFFITDDDDSDSIIPSKKVNRNEKDATFSHKEAKAPTSKTRANKLSLATTKIAAERLAKTRNGLVAVDSDDSSNSDVPGKEVYAPRLEYSAVAANDPSKWKMSKSRVSAQPKGQDVMDDAFAALAEMKAVKPRQTRAKASDAIKPVPISGKNRRAALAEGTSSRKTARGKQASKKSEKDDDEEKEEQGDLVSCPICKEEFPETQIETHVNACCDNSATKSQEGECPVCFKKFPRGELEEHSSMCDENTENLAMDED